MNAVANTTASRVTYRLGPAMFHHETAAQFHLCPDVLCYQQIGAADGWRGRIVRAFFLMMRLWPP